MFKFMSRNIEENCKLINDECNNFLDYLDARMEFMKVEPRFQIAIGYMIIERMLAVLFSNIQSNDVEKEIRNLIEGVLEEIKTIRIENI